jgi:polyisoprenyl-teichoic acid--peptidoglycan teichoic acid transferase
MRTLARFLTLGLVLAITGLVVPDSSRASTQVALVKFEHAEAVALDRETVWILGVGSDARPGEEMTRTRADAIQLVGLNTVSGAATTIGIPRDSYVAIPGVGSDRINAALYYGGPQLLGEAVADLIGIEPDYVVVTRFPFFENMINNIGGIAVDNPRYFSDSNLKPLGFESGRIRLNGYGAMAFSRIRKTLPGGDFDRSANQQIVLRGIQERIAERVGQSGFIASGVLTVMEHMDVGGTGPAELFRLGQAIAQVDPRKITGCVVQGSIATVNTASVVLPYTEQARRYGDDARNDAVIDEC